jgi:tRNA threonylcarbamoyladenosine biosynthesis protein TsaE
VLYCNRHIKKTPDDIIKIMKLEVSSENETKAFGQKLGSCLHGGEIIELIGDVGSGKTTLVKGVAVGLGIDEYIQSPSFNINRVYEGRNDLILSHYDFYRLEYAGIMANELQEVIGNQNTITVVEWGGVVSGVLPTDRLTIKMASPTEDSRILIINSGGPESQKLIEMLK